jgi:hypothetical protein
VVEPEDTDDTASAIVDSEFKKLIGFEVTGSDGANGFGPGKKGASARKGDGL